MYLLQKFAVAEFTKLSDIRFPNRWFISVPAKTIPALNVSIIS
jgi:hypothetical protein